MAEENTYNRTVKRIFNDCYSGFLNYQMNDQSQTGTTQNWHKNGELGAGMPDLLVIRRDSILCLIEGLCLNKQGKKNKMSKTDEEYVDEHVSRLYSYNMARAPMGVILVYVQAENVARLWEDYVAYLEKPKSARWGEYNFLGVGEKILYPLHS